MKLSITAGLLTALALTSVSAKTVKTPEEKCQKKNGNAVTAIQRFCANTKIVVPSDYALKGTHVSNLHAKDAIVSIQGSCSPAQWVPQKYCLSQFYAMCADSADGSHGDSTASFGRKGCQRWNIAVGVNIA